MEHWWSNTPWRLIQTNMREIDMRDIRADEYVQKLLEFKATVVMINVGGILASYDTQVEDHPVSPFLTGDSLETLIDACHTAGIRVIARMDFSKVRRAVYEKHPEWAYRTADGGIIDYNGDVHVCPSGGYQRGKAFEIVAEAAGRFPIDGVFINMGGFLERDYSYRHYGICHCANCREKFEKMFGLQLPDVPDMNDPVYRKYKVYQETILRENAQRMLKLIKSINPEIAVEGTDFSRVESNTEYKERKGPQWMYGSSSTARCETALKHGNVCSNAAVDFVGFFYRHVAVNEHMQALRMWQDLGNYAGLDYYLMGRIDNHKDRRLFRPVKEAFSFMAEHDEDYRGMFISGDALLLRDGRYIRSDEAKGWIRALTESHIFFEEGAPASLHSAEELRRFKAVILPDLQILSDETLTLLDAYVREGGCLITSGKAGLYSKTGEKREGFGLDCIGGEKILEDSADMRSAMFKIRREEAGSFPSFADTELVFFGDDYRYASYHEDVQKYLGLIPPHKYGPPERCYYTEETDEPGLTVNRFGKGKAIQIPWLPGTLYCNEGYENTFFFMKDVLTAFAGLETAEAQPFTPMVEITRGMREDQRQAMFSFINGTGHFGRSFFAPVPVQNISVCAALPGQPVSLHSIVTGKQIPFTYENGKIRFLLDKLEAFEALKAVF